MNINQPLRVGVVVLNNNKTCIRAMFSLSMKHIHLKASYLESYQTYERFSHQSFVPVQYQVTHYIMILFLSSK